MIIGGSSHLKLANDLAYSLNLPSAEVEISKFPNGEKRVWVKTPLENKSVVIVQSFSEPPDEHIIEFCLLADAAKMGGAKKIIGVIPWVGYSPQDKLFRAGEPISVRVITHIIGSLEVDRVIVADIHSPEALNHFPMPVTEVSALSLFIDHFHTRNLANHVVVALDRGATPRAEKFAHTLNLPLAQFIKTRDRNTGKIAFTSLEGAVAGKHAISFDDFLSTGNTSIQAAHILKQRGALTYTDCTTHSLLTGDSPQLLQASEIDALITTDSYPISPVKHFPKLTILPIVPVLAKATKPLL